MMAPKVGSPCRSRSAKGEWLRRFMTMLYGLQQPGRKNFRHAGDRRFRIKTTQSGFVVQRGKERQDWNERKLPKALLGYSGRRLPGSSTDEIP